LSGRNAPRRREIATGRLVLRLLGLGLRPLQRGVALRCIRLQFPQLGLELLDLLLDRLDCRRILGCGGLAA